MPHMDVQNQLVKTEEKVLCYHCGQPCDDETFFVDDKKFCCYGCKVVFELINENNLCEYYNIESHPGVQADKPTQQEYAYLDEPKVRRKLIEFDSPDFARVRFVVPNVHCASCIWLLENLQKVDGGVFRSEVNFNRKEVAIEFSPVKTNLAALATKLDALGYAPRIQEETKEKEKETNLSLVIKLGVAGFAFGNIMLFSFPEYLGLNPNDASLGRLFSWLNFALAIPVLVYSAQDYFTSAWKSFGQKQINIDVPIALGLIALFFRSSYDIISATGPGYLDSFTGLVFFLLIGRWFQNRTYESLSFERDFKSYFPLAVQKIVGEEFQPTVIYELQKGDQIQIRNLEIIPADSILLNSVAFIDYSFVTGEARPVKAQAGDLLYAGGRLLGEPVKMVVDKETSQSHLTSLWNKDAFRKKYESRYRKIIDRSARIFTWIVLAIAALTATYWYFVQPSEMWLVLTSVLMVACPCALALAAPFTYGSMLRAFGRNQFYLKNADVIERLAVVDAVVFDKTGTVTHGQEPKVTFVGRLNEVEQAAVRQLTSYSTHPLSVVVNKSLKKRASIAVTNFREIPGRGIEATVDGIAYRIGSAELVGAFKVNAAGSTVFVSVDDEVRGYFLIEVSLRQNIQGMLSRLGSKCTALLSGDNSNDETLMGHLFPKTTDLRFNQQPGDKMDYIQELQRRGKKVLMIGDGLNDAGALKQADVGIAITDDAGLFTPGCDGILQGSKLQELDGFLVLAKKSSTILKIAFGISFMYNAIALTVAVTGHLTPLVAAILMPISSVSVVGFATIAVNQVVKRKMKNSSI